VSPRTISIDGLGRQYVVHLPPGYEGTTPAPLVFSLHGFGGDIDDQDTATGLPKAAGERGYIVVTPQGAPLSVPADAAGVPARRASTASRSGTSSVRVIRGR
jgi:poly(3-hydroxybutyrate) depolymerase